MADDTEATIRKIDHLVLTGIEQAFSSNVTCPECSKEIQISRQALYKDNKLTMSLCPEQGHLLQAETLGGTMTAFAKIMKARARELGVDIEIVIPDIRFTPKQIEIDFMSLAVCGESERSSKRKKKK